MVELKITGGRLVDPRGGEPIAATVSIDGGKVIAVGDDQPADKVLDATGMLVLPGLVDAHDHLRDLTPGLSLAEGLSLDALLRVGWQLSETADPAEYRVAAALATARLLKAGVTTVVDHIYPLHRAGLVEASIEGYEATGIRWFMARGIMTKPYEPICESADRAFGSIEQLVTGPVPPERLFIAPVSLRQAEPEVFERARQLADKLSLRLYTHIAETEAEVDSCLQEHGLRPVELMHRLGFAGRDTVLVHCVKLVPSEIDLLASSATTVVHCPSNNMRLAKGVTQVPELLRAGVNVCLGVDAMDDVFAEMRQEVYLQSLQNADPAILPTQTALRMATVNGARAVGHEDLLGVVEVGRLADVICVDVSSLHLQPIIDPVWTLVNRAHGHDVRHVVVDGKVVVEDGSLTLLDEAELAREVRVKSEAVMSRVRASGHLGTGSVSPEKREP